MANNYYRKSSNRGLKIFALILAIIVIVEGVVIAAAVGSQGFTKGFDDWFNGWGKGQVEQPIPEEPGDGSDNPEAPAADDELPGEEPGEEGTPESNPTDEQSSAGYNAVSARKTARAVSTVSEPVLASAVDEPITVYTNTKTQSATSANKNITLGIGEWKSETSELYSEHFEYKIRFEAGLAYYSKSANRDTHGNCTFRICNGSNLSEYLLLKIEYQGDSTCDTLPLPLYTYKLTINTSNLSQSANEIIEGTQEIRTGQTATAIGPGSSVVNPPSTARSSFIFTLSLTDSNVQLAGDTTSGFCSTWARKNYDIESEMYNSLSSIMNFDSIVIQVTECSNGNSGFAFKAKEDYTLSKNFPKDPVKEGYDFVGWYYDEEFTQPYDGEPITADTQLYAKFEIKKFNVDLYFDDGTQWGNLIANWGESIDLTVINGDIITQNPKEGYDFLGWFYADGTQYTNQPITEELTLYGHWQEKQCTITFNTDGGTAMEPVTVTHGSTYVPETPVREGYDFTGWYEDEALTDAYDSTSEITSDKTLYAAWELQCFTVTFDTAGGNEIESRNVGYGMLLVSDFQPTPERTGYDFIGWYLNGEEYVPTPITSDLTLTAHWQIKMFTVTFYVDGEVYTTAEVAYGTKLSSVMTETANLMNLKVTALSAGANDGNFAEVEVTEDLEVSVEEMSGADKVLNILKNYVWWIVGGAAGVIVLVGVIVAVVCAKKPKKAVKRGRK